MAGIICRQGDRGSMVRAVQRLLHLYQDGIFGVNTKAAVMDFQMERGLLADGVVGLRTWSKLIGIALQPKSRREIREIIVHCTATRAGIDCTVDDVRFWHKQQGWSDIGYHYLIYRDGSIHEGRDVDVVGAHCTGHNTYSIGVCYVGGMSRDGRKAADTRTVAQAEALELLLMELRRLYPSAKIHGHRDFAAKACPSFDATSAYKDI